MEPQSTGPASQAGILPRDLHVRRLFWHTLGRLVALYLVPLLVLGAFFHLQYGRLVRDSHRAHLEVIAEHQAATFDLFLRERLVNLDNVVDDPAFHPDCDESRLSGWLGSIRQTSDAFVDLAVVTASGDLVAYAGPVRYPAEVNYASEEWFRQLTTVGATAAITEIYPGLRGRPHFTLAVRRGEGRDAVVLRAALSPERLADYLTGLEGAEEVHAAIVSAQGDLQVSTARSGAVLRSSPFVPPRVPALGFVEADASRARPEYAYAWLHETPWALVITSGDRRPGPGRAESPFQSTLFIATVGVCVAVAGVILVRSAQVVRRQVAAEVHEAELSGQLVHASRLASVGELAAGIAHEINNPLAIVAEEVGVLRDSFDPELQSDDDEPLDLQDHLNAIHEAVFRCRDITRKLLTFVRQSEVRVEPHDVTAILDDVVDVMLGTELAVSNVIVIRRYEPDIPWILTDRNQLVQVFVNLVKNAMDAMPHGGTLTLTAAHRTYKITVSVGDTGCGMTADQLERVFAPFFTTKEPGLGTGLGLSVSYSIIRSFGGDFYVSSAPGRGSTFTVELPAEARPHPSPSSEEATWRGS